jgi:hypothetical protein
MGDVTRVPRSRGAFSGVLLIILGAWGGLAPFVGHYLHVAYVPDNGWHITSGRLWLSIVPGAAALLGGLLAAASTHRGVGGFGAFIAALGGAWFILGASVTKAFVTSGSISPGRPLGGTLGSLSVAERTFLEQAVFFTGLGVLILFFAALALGRFAVVGVHDAELAGDEDQASGEALEPEVSYPPITGQFPATPGALRGPG